MGVKQLSSHQSRSGLKIFYNGEYLVVAANEDDAREFVKQLRGSLAHELGELEGTGWKTILDSAPLTFGGDTFTAKQWAVGNGRGVFADSNEVEVSDAILTD